MDDKRILDEWALEHRKFPVPAREADALLELIARCYRLGLEAGNDDWDDDDWDVDDLDDDDWWDGDEDEHDEDNMITNLFHVECRGQDAKLLDRLLIVAMTPLAASEAARVLVADRCNLSSDDVAAAAVCVAAGLQDKPGEDFRQRAKRKKQIDRWAKRFAALDEEQRTSVMGGLLRVCFPGRFAAAGAPLKGTVIAISGDVSRSRSSPELARAG